MKLFVDLAKRDLMPIAAFRAALDLPQTFGVAHFEPSVGARPGWADAAACELAEVQEAVLEAMPTQLPLQGWPLALPPLVTLLQDKLNQAAPLLCFDSHDIAFIVNTFAKLCQAYLHALISARSASQPLPDFEAVYASWLDSTVQSSSTVYPYVHRGEVWAVQVLRHAYGSVGLVVWTDTLTYYVEDSAAGCPLQPFTEALLQAAAARMIAAVQAAEEASSF
ncbi:MAG: hypothetical protein ACUVSX_14785 [Aggregatilineales bacterium]